MNNLPTNTTKSSPSVRRNTFISLLISGISYLYPIIVFIYIARILHPEGLGQIRFASSVAAYFTLFTGLGMSIYGLRASAAHRKNPTELSRLTSELLIIRLLSGIIVWGVYLLSMYILSGPASSAPNFDLSASLITSTGINTSTGAGTASTWLLLMICGIVILSAIPDISWLYKGMEDYTSLAWISVAAYIPGIIVLFLLVRDASDIYTYAWITVLIPMAIGIMELILADRKWNLRILAQTKDILIHKELFHVIRKHIRPLAVFLLMSCASTIYSHTDTVMLGLMQSDRVVGLYSCAAKIKSLLPVLTGALWAAALPRSADLWKRKQTDLFRTLSEKSFHVVYQVMIPLTVYFCIFAEPWILFVGGPDYLDAAWTMRLLLLAIIPIGFSNIIGGQMLIPMGLEIRLFQAQLTAAIANILLNAILIPYLSAPGAAIATIISEILVAVIAGYAVLKELKVQMFQPVNLLRTLIGCAISGLITCILMTLIFSQNDSANGWPRYIKGPFSFVIFAVLFFLIQLLLRDTLYQEMLVLAKRLCPKFLRKPLGRIVRKVRLLHCKLEMKLFPKKMIWYCPCCGTRFRAFASGSYKEHPETYNPERYAHTRQDILCPACGALPRHRILAVWCDEHKELLQNSKILYFAPEYGMQLWMKRNHVTCTTADLSAKADLKLDIQATGLQDESYDMIICNHVLEHVDDFRAALREMHRILRAGGIFICSFPMDPKVELLEEDLSIQSVEDRIRLYGQYDHKRVFGMKAGKFLEDVGFLNEEIDGKEYPKNILPEVGPGDYDLNLLFLCHKEEKCSVKVSVIVPVYNVRPYIHEAIDSVINQTYKNLEIILVDDGSTDGSGEICDQYAMIDSRIRVIHQDNQGLSAARNAGLDCMTGKVVAFLDPDDTFYPQMIRKMVETIICEKVDCVICRYQRCRTKEKMKPQKRYANKHCVSSLPKPGMYTMKETMGAIVEGKIDYSAWNKIYRRELWKELRYPVGQVYEDLDIILPLISLTKKVFILEDVLIMHRYRRWSISNTISLHNTKDAYASYKHFEAFIVARTPELFTQKQLQRYQHIILNFLLASYGQYYFYEQSERVKIEPWLAQKLSRQKQVVDIKQCSKVTRTADTVYRLFPQMLKILYPIYRMIRY